MYLSSSVCHAAGSSELGRAHSGVHRRAQQLKTRAVRRHLRALVMLRRHERAVILAAKHCLIVHFLHVVDALNMHSRCFCQSCQWFVGESA
jgi:hypothetical protein